MKSIKRILKELFKDPMGRIGLIGVVLIIMLSVLAPVISTHDITEMYTQDKLREPCGEYLFGTDNYGRDVFSRIIYGARVSLEVGIISVGIAAIFGLIFGVISGYFEG
jgi:ABC-type dipeptide/oligopeptide/nickel transport system permease subunit